MKSKKLNEINLKETNKEEIKKSIILFEMIMKNKCAKARNNFPSMFFALGDKYCDKPTFVCCGMNNFDKVMFGFMDGRLVEYAKDGYGFRKTSIDNLTEMLWKVIERDY